MNRNQRLHFIPLLLVAAFVAAQAGAASSQDAPSVADLVQGKRLYVGHCALCHGIEGTGGRGPRLDQPKLHRVNDGFALFRIIKGGLEGTEMPGFWQMSDREIALVVAYVRTLGRTEAVKLTGDVGRGKVLYETKGGCTACHIVGGVGAAVGPELSEIGARRSPAYLREALLKPSANVPDGFLVVVAVAARDGRKVRGVRVNEDSFTIQLRDAAGAFHSFRKAELAELNKEFGASTMLSYDASLGAAEIDDLVAYLASLRGEMRGEK